MPLEAWLWLGFDTGLIVWILRLLREPVAAEGWIRRMTAADRPKEGDHGAD